MGVARTAFVAGQGNHIALMNQLAGLRNLIINGGFTINQRGYVSAAVLASGTYGHDRWKAGAAGGDYSFAQLPNNTQITIAANKTLIQVIEDKDVVGGQYVLSWIGTCQARYGLNSAVPSGSYVNSPIVITGQTAGTTMSVEFGNGASTGTLGTAQLELGVADPTDFDVRHFALELVLARRFYNKSFLVGTAPAQNVGANTGESTWAASQAGATAQRSPQLRFEVEMRATPTITLFNPAAANAQVRDETAAADCTAGATANVSRKGFNVTATGAAGTTIAGMLGIHWTAEAEL